CKFLSCSRIFSYASQVLPSNTSDLIHLLFSRLVALTTRVCFKRCGNLLHKITVLKYVQGFLLPLPVVSTQHYKRFTSPSGYFKGFMSANYLFYKAFQVISKLIHANSVHKTSNWYGNAVQ